MKYRGFMRLCSDCWKARPITDFAICNQKKNGKTYSVTSSYCRNCQNIRTKKAYMPKRYGITYDRYLEMLEEQAYVCKICEKPELLTLKGTLKQLSVDHNHKTKAVRGLLCADCNHGIGKLKSDEGIEILQRAINYIKESNEK